MEFREDFDLPIPHARNRTWSYQNKCHKCELLFKSDRESSHFVCEKCKTESRLLCFASKLSKLSENKQNVFVKQIDVVLDGLFLNKDIDNIVVNDNYLHTRKIMLKFVGFNKTPKFEVTDGKTSVNKFLAPKEYASLKTVMNSFKSHKKKKAK